MEPQPETQSIAGVFTPRLIARLHREGFEGTLRLHSGGETRVVYFRRGDIASAASNAEDDRLHTILLREGRLTAPQIEMARSRQRPGASLGKVMIELGFLTPSELLQGARRQVRQILAACFALNEGTWQTVPGPLGPEVTNLGLPVRRLIFDALLEAGDRQVIVREMGSMESVYRPGAALADALPMLRLDPAMEEVARMIDGHATLREISGRTSLDDFTVSRVVLALEILGLAQSAERPEPAAGAPPGRLIPVENDTAPGADVAILPPVIPAPTAAPAADAEDAAEPIASTPVMTAPEGRGAAGAGESGDTVRMAASEVPPAPGRRAGDRPMPRAIIDEAPPQSAAGPPAVAPPSTPAGGRSVPSEEAEPPPIPREELPAFAGGTQGQTPFWTVDPVTGEKVHEGPVELTFDGPVTPRRSAGPSVRLVAAAGAGAVVLAALVLSIYMRSRPGQTAPGPIADAGAPATIEPGRPSPDPRETTGAAADGTSVRTTEEPADAQGAAPAAAGAATNAPADRATPRGTTAAATPGSAPPEPEAPATAPPPAQRAAGVEADRLAPGRALLDAGDVSGAASAFASTLAAIPSDRIALHLMIACEEATVRKARAAVSVDDPLFVTPYAMRDRRCYRLLWGIYPDREAAALAASSVPAYFSGAGIKPVGVSIGRLRGSS